MRSKHEGKTKKILIVLAMLAILLVGGIMAYFTDIETAVNEVEMGLVDIDLNEYSDSNNTAWQNVTNVMPGDTVTKIAKINKTADSANCYIRAKITFGGDMAASNAIDDSVLTLASGWTKDNDGYYYYANPLTNTTPVDFFTAVTIPTSIDNTYADKTLTITVQAEAIQAANFNGSAPWTSGGSAITVLDYDVNP